MATTTFATVSCSNQETAEPESNLNQTQAEARIEEYANQATSELPGDVELSTVRNPTSPSCEGESGDDNHKVTVRHVFWVDGIPEENNEEIAESLHSYWNTGTWEVTKDQRPDELHIEAKNRGDNFRMNLVINQDGRPSIGVYSPCVQASNGS